MRLELLKLATEARREREKTMNEQTYSASISFTNSCAKTQNLDGITSYEIRDDWVLCRGEGWKSIFNKDAVFQIVVTEEEIKGAH